jgi:hypothetical protein
MKAPAHSLSGIEIDIDIEFEELEEKNAPQSDTSYLDRFFWRPGK